MAGRRLYLQKIHVRFIPLELPVHEISVILSPSKHANLSFFSRWLHLKLNLQGKAASTLSIDVQEDVLLRRRFLVPYNEASHKTPVKVSLQMRNVLTEKKRTGSSKMLRESALQ